MVAALAIVIALLFAGCGGERTFEPAEFVDEANRQGAGMILGEQLTSIQEGVDVFSLSFAERAGAEQDDHGHSGGSMIVTEDAEAATDELERCEGAVTLTCYRAANVVLYFDGEPSDEHIAGVDAAIRGLAED